MHTHGGMMFFGFFLILKSTTTCSNMGEQEVNHQSSSYITELSPLWPGQALCLKIKENLYHKRSAFQDIRVIKNEQFGNVLTLDGIIQCTDLDEFTYQEMIAHLPLFSHPNPRKVLIVGGGDGGVAREVAKHDKVEEIHLCEIDEEVMNVSRRYFPNMAVGFKSPKLSIHVEDGIKFMKRYENEFDVIITDSSDPIGPAVPLFQKDFYKSVFTALKDDGTLCCQGECFWVHSDLIRGCMNDLKSIYPVVEYATVNVPTYPCSQIGFFIASKNKNHDLKKPAHVVSEDSLSEEPWKLKYYNFEMHKASFVLPQFVKSIVNS